MNLVLVRGSTPLVSSTPRRPEEVVRKLPTSLPTPQFISDEDFDSLSAIGLPEECTLDSSQCVSDWPWQLQIPGEEGREIGERSEREGEIPAEEEIGTD